MIIIAYSDNLQSIYDTVVHESVDIITQLLHKV